MSDECKGLGFCGALFAVILGTAVTAGFYYRRIISIEEKVDKILAKQEIIQTNVIGNETPEKFYETPEGRAYLTIDGKPVDEYLRSR